MAQITVGLDFGTHQTKICIEERDSTIRKYRFYEFTDNNGHKQFTLPSIIGIERSGLLRYGYLPNGFRGKVERYFKQGTFTHTNYSTISPRLLSIWYLSYILFDLEEIYDTNFAIQMGAPTGSSNPERAKSIAVEILASAYHLVEDVFNGNKQQFLQSTIDELKAKTQIQTYSKELKADYQILVFPEAYACLKPLMSQKKIESGMSLMVDIGGGTTDISFFTIEDGLPQVYDYFSLNKGLNYLTQAEKFISENKHYSNVQSVAQIDAARRKAFINAIKQQCHSLQMRLEHEFTKQCKLNVSRLRDALKHRPVIFTGGGSTFATLRVPYAGFTDLHHIGFNNWEQRNIQNMTKLNRTTLCPILSTAYGLAISVADDNIKKKPFRDIFVNFRGATEGKSQYYGNRHGDFDYGLDFDAYK